MCSCDIFTLYSTLSPESVSTTERGSSVLVSQHTEEMRYVISQSLVFSTLPGLCVGWNWTYRAVYRRSDDWWKQHSVFEPFHSGIHHVSYPWIVHWLALKGVLCSVNSWLDKEMTCKVSVQRRWQSSEMSLKMSCLHKKKQLCATIELLDRLPISYFSFWCSREKIEAVSFPLGEARPCIMYADFCRNRVERDLCIVIPTLIAVSYLHNMSDMKNENQWRVQTGFFSHVNSITLEVTLLR